MPRRAHAIVAAAAIGLGAVLSQGCGTRSDLVLFSDHLYLDTSRVPCRSGGATMEILQKPPTRPYVKVAYLEAFTSFIAQQEVTWDDLRSELCRQAIAVEADAIIQLEVGSQAYSRELTVGPFEAATGGVVKKLTGVAIRYE